MGLHYRTNTYIYLLNLSTSSRSRRGSGSTLGSGTTNGAHSVAESDSREAHNAIKGAYLGDFVREGEGTVDITAEALGTGLDGSRLDPRVLAARAGESTANTVGTGHIEGGV